MTAGVVAELEELGELDAAAGEASAGPADVAPPSELALAGRT
jgi:hypothetical protein